jgi:hypothetical protein
MIDYLFLLATGAFGWGLSLATYRFFARRNSWPMGALHVEMPGVPMAIGVFALIVGLFFAVVRGAADGGWVIILFGFALALFWTGFLRVGSQLSLLLAPVCAILLLFGWATGPTAYSEAFSSPSSQDDTIQPYNVE